MFIFFKQRKYVLGLSILANFLHFYPHLYFLGKTIISDVKKNSSMEKPIPITKEEKKRHSK